MVFVLPSDKRAILVISDERAKSVLASFAYPKTLTLLNYQPEYLIIDSGAFSAWNSGKVIEVAAYASYLGEVKMRFPNALAVNLDVIPGKPGKTATRAEKEEAMAKSVENADFLRSRGFEVMEVFHQDEPFEFLDLLLSRLPDGHILGLSPRNDVSPKARAMWLKKVLSHLLRTRLPSELPKTHGLAATAKTVMDTFPFYSVDSTTYINAIRFGFYQEDGKTIASQDIFPSSRVSVAKYYGLRRYIREYERLETYYTQLWARRGVVWDS